MKHVIVLITLLINLSCSFQIYLETPIKPQKQFQNQTLGIYLESQLQQKFNDTQYHNQLTCKNNMLQIVQFDILKRTQQNLTFRYTEISLQQSDIIIEYGPNTPYPQPELLSLDDQQKLIVISNGCLDSENTDSSNYYNQLTLRFIVYDEQGATDQKSFSLLYNCDFKGRNKKFQLGYLILCVINAAITIGVALHSRIWSIRFHGKPLFLQLKWHRFLLIIIGTLFIGIALYFYAGQQFKNANIILMYIGMVIGWFFTFICADEVFFLFNPLKKQFKIKSLTIRICDILSFFVATILAIFTIIFENWILLDIIAICICVGAIKLLQFSSLRQGASSMIISTAFVTISASIMHYTLQRSYNDYASQLSSPVFFMVPDLINNLFKKCSWLPVLDIIVPGVLLSYLRGYDQNYSSNWGGVYTIVGNLSFIIGTIIWIPIQGTYNYSVPFSLVSYPALILGVCIMAYKRNQLMTLWTGRFNGPHNQFSQRLLQIKQSRESFGKMIGKDLLDEVKIKKFEQNSQIIVS